MSMGRWILFNLRFVAHQIFGLARKCAYYRPGLRLPLLSSYDPLSQKQPYGSVAAAISAVNGALVY